jgi:hypothetical protein
MLLIPVRGEKAKADARTRLREVGRGVAGAGAAVGEACAGARRAVGDFVGSLGQAVRPAAGQAGR